MRIVTLIENTQGHPCCAYEHGLSLYIETEHHKLLLDTGATDAFLKNAEVLGIDLTEVDTVVLSHGHYDHGGGLPAFARLNPSARIYLRDTAGEDYCHPTEQENRHIGIDRDILKLPQCVPVAGDWEIDGELSLFTNITGRKHWPKGNLQLKRQVGDALLQDTFDHEQCLVITAGSRRVLLSGCAHNGILNILDCYRERYGGWPDLVVSGFHMMKKTPYTGEDEEDIRETARALKTTGALYYTGHCTGPEPYRLMKEIMGEQLRPLHAGEELNLEWES